MKNVVKCLILVSLFCLPSVICHATETDVLKSEVAGAIASFERTDSGMKKLFKDSAGYVVFPKAGKGGFLFGAAHGEGLVYQKGKLVGRASLTQVTVGAQAGGQVFSEVIFFETKDVLNDFKKGNWEIGGQVSAVVAAEGQSENARYVEGVEVFTKPVTGLMVEASVGGQKFTYDAIQPSAK